MVTSFRYTLTQFTPGEAEVITGASTALQRDWRRRDYLPANEDGHARFDMYGLAELLFLKSLSDRGIGPQYAKEITDIASGGIVLGALMSAGAFEGDDHFLNGIERAVSVVRKTSRSKVLRRGVIPAQYLILWADGSETWHSNVQTAIEALPKDQREAKLGGPLTVVDQYYVGALILSRAGRPLVHVGRIDS